MIPDEQWARIIVWLQANGLQLHIPIKGPIWFSKRR